jgi:hypothetical protein
MSKLRPSDFEIIETLALVYPDDEVAFAQKCVPASEIAVPRDLIGESILPVLADGRFYWAIPSRTSKEEVRWMSWVISRDCAFATDFSFLSIAPEHFRRLQKRAEA